MQWSAVLDEDVTCTLNEKKHHYCHYFTTLKVRILIQQIVDIVSIPCSLF